MQNNLSPSITKKIQDEAEAATQLSYQSEYCSGYRKGYTAAATAILQNPGAWGLAVIIDENEAIEKVTAAMREADPLFEETGGSTRHYVRDLLLPILERSGFAFGKQESATPSDRVGQTITKETVVILFNGYIDYKNTGGDREFNDWINDYVR
jgi:hypothetical protein